MGNIVFVVCVSHSKMYKVGLTQTWSETRQISMVLINTRKKWVPAAPIHPIPGSTRSFQNWTGNMQNSDIFAKKYRTQIENNARTRHLWKRRSSYLKVLPQIWYGRFSVLKNDRHAILSKSSWMSTGLTACSKFTMNVEYFCCQTPNLILQ